MAYAGDVTSKEAWDVLAKERNAVLVDVRCDVEWSFVGVPDLSSLGKRAVLLSWQLYPTMSVDARFTDKLAAMAPDREAPLFFICRSGNRSRAAAAAMTAAGYRRCYNLADGFEGAHDGLRHRGRVAGWQAAGLSWTQD